LRGKAPQNAKNNKGNMRQICKLTSDGQITVPADQRREKELEQGDYVEVVILDKVMPEELVINNE